jgi:hypothetical protein
MSNQINAIFSALEAMSVQVDGNAPAVYGLTGLPNTVASANLPARILEIMDNAAEMSAGTHRTLSSTPGMAINWVLTDLLLYLPTAQGQGLVQVASSLVTYCGKYIDAIQVNEALIATASVIGLKVVPGRFEYPSDSGTFYFGAVATLTIKELQD